MQNNMERSNGPKMKIIFKKKSRGEKVVIRNRKKNKDTNNKFDSILRLYHLSMLM